ncbi:Protein of unknown function [Escherichia coli]|jgi:ribosome biogenesis protein ENP2
MHG